MRLADVPFLGLMFCNEFAVEYWPVLLVEPIRTVLTPVICKSTIDRHSRPSKENRPRSVIGGRSIN